MIDYANQLDLILLGKVVVTWTKDTELKRKRLKENTYSKNLRPIICRLLLTLLLESAQGPLWNLFLYVEDLVMVNVRRLSFPYSLSHQNNIFFYERMIPLLN